MPAVISIKCDTSKLMALGNKLKKSNLEEAATKAIHATGDTLQQEIPTMIDKYYHGGIDWISSAVEDADKSFMSCSIPIRGSKGGLGEVFPAGGGYSAVTVNRKTKSGKQVQYERLMKKGAKGAKGGGSVVAHIVKAGLSRLPDSLPNQGGNPPFMAGGVVMTRRTIKKFPIVHVMGLAVPQMADTRAEKDIYKMAEKELEKNLERFIGQLLG